ncbi:cytochrome c3 family protein [Anaeromyxobacter oryzisoli]|uniref:cytochrome c3 family protein n=1 Tax=Anaeromyxobacter oryzisoli TaxID=2925408 RepID=UPI001F55EC78|nr:cytochrome c3 family protein [Anaeromyxobacter sp. SG63]
MTAAARAAIALIPLALVAIIRIAAAAEPPTAPPGGTCVECHAGLGGELAKPVEAFTRDVHSQRGLGCTACHGGDPTSPDQEVAMSRAKGFRGAPALRDVPTLCGGCHADVVFMKRYAPNLPTDQLARYVTSRHATELARGNPRAAVCSSCHQAHGIVSTRDARSPVYPTRVASTCARCHARPGGQGPVERWERSVHHAALVAGDLSAPTCPRCHGSHGAAPPGVESVPAVCGQCHPRNMQLFRGSPHLSAFEAGSLSACGECHGHHDILHPDDAWVGVGKGAVCARCHAPDDPGGEAAAKLAADLGGATALLRNAEARVEAARERGMLMTDAQVALEDARQQIVQARTLVHAAYPRQVDEQTRQASVASRKALDLASRAFGEIRYRRTGLLVALVVILVTIVALLLQIRVVDARRRQANAGRR